MKEPVRITLQKRGDRYGDVDVQAGLYDELLEVIGKHVQEWRSMTPRQRQSIRMICLKISRLVCGNHDDADSWHDIEGYARLAVQGPTSSLDSEGGEPD